VLVLMRVLVEALAGRGPGPDQKQTSPLACLSCRESIAATPANAADDRASCCACWSNKQKRKRQREVKSVSHSCRALAVGLDSLPRPCSVLRELWKARKHAH